MSYGDYELKLQKYNNVASSNEVKASSEVDDYLSIFENEYNTNDEINDNYYYSVNSLSKEDEQIIISEFEAQIEELEINFETAEKSNGWISGLWNSFKNLTGIGASSNKTQKQVDELKAQIKDLKEGKSDLSTTYKNITGKDLTSEELTKFITGETTLLNGSKAGDAVNKYSEGQKMSTDIVADIAAGVASVGAVAIGTAIGICAAPFTAGASLGMIAAGFGVGAATGAAVKVAIKGSDCIGNEKEYGLKDVGYDLLTGSINGAMGPLSNGLGSVAGTATMKAMGMEALETTVKTGFKTTATKVIGSGVNMVVDGTVSGATDGFARALGEGRIEDIPQDMMQGAVGGAIASPIIGGGFNLAGKAGSKIGGVISNKIEKEVSKEITEELGEQIAKEVGSEIGEEIVKKSSTEFSSELVEQTPVAFQSASFLNNTINISDEITENIGTNTGKELPIIHSSVNDNMVSTEIPNKTVSENTTVTVEPTKIEGNTTGKINTTQFKNELTKFLEDNYVSANDLRKMLEKYPNMPREIGVLPDSWLSNNATNYKQISDNIYSAIADFQSSRNVQELADNISKTLGKEAQIEEIGSGNWGTSYKISVEGSEPLCLKVFNNPTGKVKSYLHGAHIEPQVALFINKHSDEYVKMYFGRINDRFEHNGFLVTQFLDDTIEPKNVDILTEDKYIFNAYDATLADNTINGKIIDFGGIEIYDETGDVEISREGLDFSQIDLDKIFTNTENDVKKNATITVESTKIEGNTTKTISSTRNLNGTVDTENYTFIGKNSSGEDVVYAQEIKYNYDENGKNVGAEVVLRVNGNDIETYNVAGGKIVQELSPTQIYQIQQVRENYATTINEELNNKFPTAYAQFTELFDGLAQDVNPIKGSNGDIYQINGNIMYGRPKTVVSLGDKIINKIKGGTNIPDIDTARKIVEDGIGTRLIVDKIDEESMQEITDRLCQEIEEGHIKITQINNYRGEGLPPYFTEEQIGALKNSIEIRRIEEKRLGIYDETLKDLKIITGNHEKAVKASGYTAFQMNVIYENGTLGEIQIRGREMDKLAEVEHIPYDTRQGKKLKSKYDNVVKIIKALSDSDYEKYQKYWQQMYEYTVKKERGLPCVKPELPDGIPKEISYEELQKI